MYHFQVLDEPSFTGEWNTVIHTRINQAEELCLGFPFCKTNIEANFNSLIKLFGDSAKSPLIDRIPILAIFLAFSLHSTIFYKHESLRNLFGAQGKLHDMAATLESPGETPCTLGPAYNE